MAIHYDLSDKIGIITLDRPPVNALNAETLTELRGILTEISETPDIRCVIITAPGDKFFVAGADINEFVGLDMNSSIPMTKRFQDTFAQISNLSCPVIAAINGLTLGGGNELAMACDIRVASENAVFGQPEVGLGLIPGGGGTQRLSRLVPFGKAKLMNFGVINMTAKEAEAAGLVDVVVEKGKALEAAKEIANKISQMAPIAVAQVKKAMNYGYSMPINEAISYELDRSAICFGSEDIKEGVEAFLNKRKAEFKNK